MEIREEIYTLEFADEVDAVIYENLEENKVVYADTDWKHMTYIREHRAGSLVVVVARDKGKAVGFLMHWIMQSPNHNVLQAQQAGIVVDKEHRTGFTGLKMIKKMEKILKKRGVDVMVLGSTPKLDISPLFKRLGFQEAETVYFKEI